MKEHTQRIIDSGSSYVGGGLLVFGIPIVDITNMAQAIGLIIGVVVISVKLIYDVMKLKRDFFNDD